jgi:hypothetical protein
LGRTLCLHECRGGIYRRERVRRVKEKRERRERGKRLIKRRAWMRGGESGTYLRNLLVRKQS